MPKVTMHRVSKLLTLSTLPMSQAVKMPRVSACEPLCARLGAGVACVPAFAHESERGPFVPEVLKSV